MRGSFSKLALILSSFFVFNSSFGNSYEEEETHEDEIVESQSIDDSEDRLGFVNFVDPSKVFLVPSSNFSDEEFESIYQEIKLEEYWNQPIEEEINYGLEIKYTELELENIRERDPEDGMRDLVFKELQRYGKNSFLPGVKEWARDNWPELYDRVDGMENSFYDLRDKTLAVQEEGKEVNDKGEEVVVRRVRAYATFKDDGTIGKVTYRNLDYIGVDGRVRWDGRFTAEVEYKGKIFGFSPDLKLDVEPLTGEYVGRLMMSKPLGSNFKFFPKFWGKGSVENVFETFFGDEDKGDSTASRKVIANSSE